MTPHATIELPSAPPFDHCAGSIDDGFARSSIIGALLEALNAPEAFQVFHREGELFLEPAVENA